MAQTRTAKQQLARRLRLARLDAEVELAQQEGQAKEEEAAAVRRVNEEEARAQAEATRESEAIEHGTSP